MSSKNADFPQFERVRDAALRALRPVKPAGQDTKAPPKLLFTAQRTDAGRRLPPHYLVYFLLVELLGFPDLGQFEKVAWSVPIDFKGRAFLIEHRKFGIGVFANSPEDEEDAKQIVIRIQKAVKAAQPYFDWLAQEAVARSALNVLNNSSSLFDRFSYLLNIYRTKADEAEARKDEKIVDQGTHASGSKWWSTTYPAIALRKEARYLALAAIEAFFSWTEHTFIHIAILLGKIQTGEEVARLAEAEWATKYTAAIGLSDPRSKLLYDKLLDVRKELRNFVAHGSFGKQGEAFQFHSSAGAVPVLLPHRAGNRKYKLGSGLDFDPEAALNTIDEFIQHLWAGDRAPAKLYLQDNELPVILTFSTDGTYASGMRSVEAMEDLVQHLGEQIDRAANMDW